jgi:hypothetical protein
MLIISLTGGAAVILGWRNSIALTFVSRRKRNTALQMMAIDGDFYQTHVSGVRMLWLTHTLSP